MIRTWAIALVFVTASAAADQRPVLALVIDDLGYSLDNGIAAIDLQGDHTYAILPGSTYARRLAQRAHQLGKEVILHMPMQSVHARAAQEPDELNDHMDENQLTDSVHSLLESVPYIRGVNNHQGSHLTEFGFLMRPVMDSIRNYDPQLYFLDSRTSPLSVAYTEALDAGLASIRRDVFLDNETNAESIYLQFRIWLNRAREHGSAIAIGHPHPETLQLLRSRLPAAASRFEYLPVSQLIELRRSQSSGLQQPQRAHLLQTSTH